MIGYEVRNARTNCLVRTFGSAKDALDWAKAHSHSLGDLNAYAVETIRRERLITSEPEIVSAKRRAS